jgi:uncharacterized protein (DUF488 family)
MPDDFLALLQRHEIRTVVDVRLRPDRAYKGLWTKATSADKGIERLLADRLAEVPGPICLLCAEKDAAECHRALVAEWLARTRGADVVHLT